MMKSASRLLPLFLVTPVLLALSCGVPLPAPELTATAESQAPAPQEQSRSGSVVESASSGAPSNSALSLQQTADDSGPLSALAPLEHEELAGATPTVEETLEADVEAAATEESTPEDEPTETATPEPETEAVAADEGTVEAEVDTSGYAMQLFELLNEFRTENGIPALQYNETLSASASAYAAYMATTNFFGHYPPSGSTPAGRIAAAGFEGQYEGEALSAGQPTPAVALSRLLGSPAHAKILLNPNAIAVGVGYAYDASSYYGSYWAIVTANP
jgi:uncharacterized protein YkwD